jgi:hypothetical protein
LQKSAAGGDCHTGATRARVVDDVASPVDRRRSVRATPAP